MGKISALPFYNAAFDQKIHETLGNTECYQFGFNYVTGHPDEWYSYLPIYLGRPDDDLDPPENITWMVESFIERRHAGGQSLPLYIDQGHGAFGEGQLIIGDVIDIKELPAESVVMTSPDGLEQPFDIPNKSKWLMGKIRIKASELANVKDGKYGLRPSIAFDPENKILLNLAFCQVPAIEEVPAIVLRAKSKPRIKSLELELQLGKEKRMDPTLLEALTGLLNGMGIPAPDVAIITTISDEGASMLIASLQQIAPAPPAEDPAPPTETMTTLTKEDMKATFNEWLEEKFDAKSKELDELKKELETRSKKLEDAVERANKLPTEFRSKTPNPDKELDELPDHEFRKTLELRAKENKTTLDIEYAKWQAGRRK